MEFSRFGGNITNGYWGCCACCIIQDFNQAPDEKASIQLVDGDGGTAILGGSKGEQLFAGPTYKDIFLQRLRFGTFGISDMPNHAFLAILTQGQIDYGYGKQWLALLKENGFEFIRTINNSVYTGPNLLGTSDEECEYDDDSEDMSPIHGNSANYLFGLFRNIGMGAAGNPFVPPKAWTDIKGGVEEAWVSGSEGHAQQTKAQQDFHLEAWNKLPLQDTLMTEAQLREQKVPVWLSGRRVAEAKPKIKPADQKSKEVSLKGVADTNMAGIAKVVKTLPEVASDGIAPISFWHAG
jgi:hypothetical protein